MAAVENLERYPLKQLLTPTDAGAALFAVTGLIDELSKPESYLVIGEKPGGWIYAANEAALEQAREIVAAALGTAAANAEPQVHTFLDPAHGAVVEPVMFLRVKAPRGYAALIAEDLARRGVSVLEHDMQRFDVVVRAEGRLADLIGYERASQVLTHGTAVVWNWLLRYQLAACTKPAAIQAQQTVVDACPVQLHAQDRRAQSLLAALLRKAAS